MAPIDVRRQQTGCGGCVPTPALTRAARPDDAERRSPMRNRVTPLGDIVAIDMHGAWLGNRGILHEGFDVVKFHSGNLWIICALEHKGWRLPQWAKGHLTVLFFHDEAVALAAGHRPCALCRREAYNSYRSAWARGLGSPVPSAKDIDQTLHSERIVRGSHRRRLHPMEWRTVPAGAFVRVAGQSAIALDDVMIPWSLRGYEGAIPRPSAGTVEVITPPSSVAVLRAGYRPQIDASAAGQPQTWTDNGTTGEPQAVSVVLRRAGAADAKAAAETWVQSRLASVGSIPPPVHSPEEMRAWFCDVVVPTREVWIAETRDAVVAVLVLHDGWVDQLYVHPHWTGRGVGSQLLDLAKSRSRRLDLWAFQSNLAAKRFYERHGFVEIERTDGSSNEERAPDVHYRWAGA
jgi:GNAT superfamily N-acetyltransferase